ncbi:cell division protein SepF [Halomicrobium urmianum]|uniref:cell division protein SepF n=1 Tax=Halomicrobium urmianum TaxID=1586233 RepID=UPI001CD98DEA|nr:cell division protein SepF [Halomicrobium urmianum]
MGLMSKILGDSGPSRQTEDYVELNADDFDASAGEADRQVRIARIGEKGDVIDIKDAVYDGDIVIADITRHSTQDRTMEHISDELKQVADEVGGDIVQKDDDQLIITPSGVAISRERLGR